MATAGLVFGLVFQLIFVAAGAGACYWGYRMYYVEGAPWQGAAMIAGFGAVFILVGLFGVVRLFRRRRQAAERERLREKHADTPWMMRPAWRDGRIETSEQDSGQHGFLVLFVVLWNAFSWPIAYFGFFGNPGEGTSWFLLLFPLVGLAFIAYLIYVLLRGRKYGDTVLELETLPGVLGGRFTGVARTGVNTDAVPEEGFHVMLSCYRRREHHDDDGKDVDMNLLWRDEKRLRGQPYSADDGTQKLEVPVSFAVPADQPASTAVKTKDRILWRLDLSAEVPGIDYREELEVPVFETEESAAPNRDAAKAEAQEASAADAPSHEEAATASAQQTAPARDTGPYADHEVEQDFHEPVSAGIAVRPSTGGGTEFFFDKARNKTLLAIVSVLFLGFSAGMVFALRNIMLWEGLLVAALAAFFGYLTYRQATYTTTLTVESGQVDLRRGPFGGGTPKTFPASELESASVSVAGRSGNNARYRLKLLRADTGQEHKVAGGLDNKQEADWLAEQIEVAAKREARYG